MAGRIQDTVSKPHNITLHIENKRNYSCYKRKKQTSNQRNFFPSYLETKDA